MTSLSLRQCEHMSSQVDAASCWEQEMVGEQVTAQKIDCGENLLSKSAHFVQRSSLASVRFVSPSVEEKVFFIIACWPAKSQRGC
ncbi:hypothetical protein PAMP_013949 [Pampus punctatissimus]